MNRVLFRLEDIAVEAQALGQDDVEALGVVDFGTAGDSDLQASLRGRCPAPDVNPAFSLRYAAIPRDGVACACAVPGSRGNSIGTRCR